MNRFLERVLPKRLTGIGPVIPVLRLSGTIGAAVAFRPGLTLEALAGPLRQAFAPADAPAVALIINSPGGAAAQSHLIYRRIRSLAEAKNKRVLAFVEDVGASGGYMIALAADEIVADPSSIIGSIGVVAASFGFHKAMERIGVERRLYSAGDRKVLLDPFSPQDERDVEHLAALQRDVHAMFIELVKNRRGDRLGNDPELFSGAIWTGTRARELGLVDGLGDVRSELISRYGEKVRLRPIPVERGFWRRRRPFQVGPGLAAAELDAIISLLEERALWGRFGL
jgi:signal peptide peptidase SppA